eukprot:74583-Prymnesium_polylepis.1
MPRRNCRPRSSERAATRSGTPLTRRQTDPGHRVAYVVSQPMAAVEPPGTVVLRGVDITLSDDAIANDLVAQVGDVEEVVRFRRSSRRDTSLHRPLPLVRIVCSSAKQRDTLLSGGAILGGA